MNPLYTARLQAGYVSRKDAAKLIGIHRDVLGRYERGVHRVAPDVLVKAADLYGVTVDQLLGREPLPATDPHAPDGAA